MFLGMLFGKKVGKEYNDGGNYNIETVFLTISCIACSSYYDLEKLKLDPAVVKST